MRRSAGWGEGSCVLVDCFCTAFLGVSFDARVSYLAGWFVVWLEGVWV